MSFEQQQELGDPSGHCSPAYWDDWFRSVSHGDRFEWYCDTPDVLAILSWHFETVWPECYVFHAGTGNSELAFELSSEHGLKRAVAMDCSVIAIEEMRNKASAQYDGTTATTNATATNTLPLPLLLPLPLPLPLLLPPLPLPMLLQPLHYHCHCYCHCHVAPSQYTFQYICTFAPKWARVVY